MKGLIQNNMQGPAEEAEDPQAPAEQDAAGIEGDDGTDADENDPAYRQALQFAMSALYENGAAKQVAETLRKSKDIPEALATTAYEIISIADERTQGAMSDELIVLFASDVLEEIVDIATAAGIQVKPSDIAEAVKQMIARYVAEGGGDPRQLQAAMDQIDTSAFDADAAEFEAKGVPPA